MELGLLERRRRAELVVRIQIFEFLDDHAGVAIDVAANGDERNAAVVDAQGGEYGAWHYW